MLRTCPLFHLTVFCAEVSLGILLEPDTKTLTVLVGEPATLRCSVTGGDLKNYQVSWYKKTEDNITDPDPAVYQLKSPKSSKTSVCLFTDFDSEKKMPQSQEGTVIMSNGTVLDMRVMDSKSNGVLAWSNSTDFKCNSTFNEKFYSSSGEYFSCNATLIEKSFETDMNLNAHNLLVMGLRVLLLKVAGFNLFVTLRLWSR
uniref:Ig-like domain-containing protein n=1 Tax=Ailuropoda melanoleuca TaxID=9646 RepID=A0A7N5KR19_AILME